VTPIFSVGFGWATAVAALPTSIASAADIASAALRRTIAIIS
jgi:hypothetical protein